MNNLVSHINLISKNEFDKLYESYPLNLAQMTLDDENLTEDFTAMVFALNMFFNMATGQDIDVIDFTHLMNKLAFQHLMDDYPTEKGGAE